MLDASTREVALTQPYIYISSSVQSRDGSTDFASVNYVHIDEAASCGHCYEAASCGHCYTRKIIAKSTASQDNRKTELDHGCCNLQPISTQCVCISMRPLPAATATRIDAPSTSAASV